MDSNPVIKGNKKIILIIIYRIPQSSNRGVCTSIAQYNQMRGKVQSTTHYQKEILEDIKWYLETIENSFEIVIGGDYNQDIASKDIVDFYLEIGVRDMHSF